MPVVALRHEPEQPPGTEAAAFILGLRSRGVSDLALLRAMERVPREVFAPRRYGDLARQDVALPLAYGETMTAPATVALMLSALGVRPGHRVLEVGAGSGYVSTLLAAMGGLVESVERHPVLAESARQRLAAIGLGPSCRLRGAGDRTLEEADERFDRILLNGSVPALPSRLTSRLAAGGRLVGAVPTEAGGAALVTVNRGQEGTLHSRAGAPLRISRLMPVGLLETAARATDA